ncbi:MAG TPA: sigma factor-like helix-turn-helix DNA-binding protein [Tepidisphaeraceae bacterium]|jgi:hypothetical protein
MKWRIAYPRRLAQAVLLRFYQQKNFAQVGQSLGVSEEAARKRVGKATEQLRKLLARQGMTVPAASLSAALLAKISPTAPAGLIASCHTVAANPAASISILAKGGQTMTFTAKLKVAALVLGACVLVPAGAEVFILARPTRGQNISIVGLPVKPTTLTAPTTTSASDQQSREKFFREAIACATNMTEINRAIVIYCKDHHGKYPSDLGTLFLAEQVNPRAFLCPSSTTHMPTDFANKSDEDQAAWINKNSDYIYIGKGLTTADSPDRTVLYDKEPDQDHKAANALFRDGHIDINNPAGLQRLIAQDAKNRAQPASTSRP